MGRAVGLGRLPAFSVRAAGLIFLARRVGGRRGGRSGPGRAVAGAVPPVLSRSCSEFPAAAELLDHGSSGYGGVHRYRILAADRV